MADPVIDNIAGTATINFDSSTNHTLSKTSIGNSFGSGSLYLAPQNYLMWEDFNSSSLDFSTKWNTNNMTAQDTTQSKSIETSSYQSSSTANGNKLSTRAIQQSSPTNERRIFTMFFYDDGNTGAGNEEWFTCQTAAVTTTSRGILAIGWDTDSAGTNHYSYSLSGAAAVDTGITRATGLHKIVLMTDFAVTVDDATYIRKIYLDGASIYSETQTLAAGDPAPFSTAWRAFAWTIVDAIGDNINVDDLLIGHGSNNFFEEGTDQIDIQPGAVDSFDSVTVDDDDTGAWKGTITYQFQHSTDGGSNFGSLTTLNDTNLAALTPAGNGLDVLRIKTTLTPDSTASLNQAYYPKVNQIVVNFTSKFLPQINIS